MKKNVLLLFFCLLTFTSAFAQKESVEFTGTAAKVEMEWPEPITRQFTNFRVYSLNSQFLKSKIEDKTSYLKLKLAEEFDLDITLFPHDVRSENYVLRVAEGNEVVDYPRSENITYRGHTSQGGEVRLTIADQFISGSIDVDGDVLYIEPLSKFFKRPMGDKFIAYKASEVIEDKTKTCGITEAQNDLLRGRRDQLEELAKTQALNMMNCVEVELAIASDFLMFQSYGSVANVEAHTLSIMNLVGGDYSGKSFDEVQFNIVTQFVSTSLAMDPVSSSRSANTVLSEFTGWASGGGFGVSHDLGQFWTDRDFLGGTIGIAWVGTVCTNNRYHCIQDFSTNQSSLRVVTSHEIGHNFNCPHNYNIGSNCDPPGRGRLIMDPTVSSTAVSWSTGSETCARDSEQSIQNHINSRTCLGTCGSSTPLTADFFAIPQNICQGEQVAFTDISTGNPTSWSWSFPGGTPNTSTQQNPVITYNNAGTYSVTLVVFNSSGGQSFETKVNYIEVCGAPPVSNFIADATTICANSTVNFFDQSSNDPTTWFWEFPGGTPSFSTDENPSVFYGVAGDFDVSLTAGNAGGPGNTEYKSNYIEVGGIGTATCIPNANLPGLGGITRVVLETLNQSSGLAFADGSNYVDFSCFPGTTILEPSEQYELRLSFGNCSSNVNEMAVVYLDANNDGDFDDQGERLGTFSGGFDCGTHDIDIVTPPDPVRGEPLRMRIITDGSFVSDGCHSPITGQTEDYAVEFEPVAPLPVELKSFTGRAIEAYNLLEWNISTEINNDYYTLERSEDGALFEPIAVIKGKGTVSTASTYQHVDKDSGERTQYYQLKQTDFDGTETLIGNIIAITRSSNGGVKLFPNPVSNQQARLVFDQAQDEVLNIRIFSANGQLVRTMTNQPLNKEQQVDLDLGVLSAGVYWLEVVGEKQFDTIRFVKK